MHHTKSMATIDLNQIRDKEEIFAKETQIEENRATEGKVQYDVMGSIFSLPEKYILTSLIGSGAYGIVVAVQDTEEEGENNMFAIKKIEKAFDHKVFAQRTLRELKIMRLLNHDNVLTIKDIFLPEEPKNFEAIYVMSELMETDLAQVIKSKQHLSDDHI